LGAFVEIALELLNLVSQETTTSGRISDGAIVKAEVRSRKTTANSVLTIIKLADGPGLAT
jgi:hypothetical protein